LVAPVARVAHHLDLRDAVEAERAQEGETLLDDLLHPYRLADPGAAHVAARLAQLAAREEPERPALAVEVAAERVHLLRGTRNEHLHHRLVRPGGYVSALELGRRLAAEELAPMAAPEADVRRRLDDQRKAEFLAGCERLVRRMRIARERDGNADGFRRLELVALALDPLQNLPARKGKAVALGE